MDRASTSAAVIASPRPPAIAARGTLALVTAGVLVVWALHNAFAAPWEAAHVDRAAREPALLALRVLAWLAPIAAYLARFDPRPRLVAFGISGHVDRRGLLRGSIAGAAFLATVGGLASASSPRAEPGAFVGWLASPFALYMVVLVVFEELLWRGFLLGQLVRHVSSRRAQWIVAALFAGMHLPGWIAQGGLHPGLAPMTIVLLVLGLVLGYAARASGTIALPIVLHVANNVIAQWFNPG